MVKKRKVRPDKEPSVSERAEKGMTREEKEQRVQPRTGVEIPVEKEQAPRASSSQDQKARRHSEEEKGLTSADESSLGSEAAPSTSATAAQQKKDLAQEYLEHLQRTQAEFANYRKRVQREMLEAYDHGKAELMCRLLPVMDDLERALESLASDCESDDALRGVKLIYEKLRSTLQAEGLEAIECKGQEFDPNFHEAVVVTKVKEGRDCTIIRDFQKGYTYKGRLIRPSKVEVTQLQTDSGDE